MKHHFSLRVIKGFYVFVRDSSAASNSCQIHMKDHYSFRVIKGLFCVLCQRALRRKKDLFSLFWIHRLFCGTSFSLLFSSPPLAAPEGDRHPQREQFLIFFFRICHLFFLTILFFLFSSLPLAASIGNWHRQCERFGSCNSWRIRTCSETADTLFT